MSKNIIILVSAGFLVLAFTIGLVTYLFANNNSSPPPADKMLGSAPTQKEISLDEITKHASEADCWVYINGTVYDATTVIAKNATLKDQLVAVCGSDGKKVYMVLKYDQQDIDKQTIAKLKEQLSGHTLGVLTP